VVLTIPDRTAGLERLGASVGIAVSVCIAAWIAGGAVGMDSVGHGARLFASLIFGAAASSAYHAVKSEPPALR
jgi:hypothetical protein